MKTFISSVKSGFNLLNQRQANYLKRKTINKKHGCEFYNVVFTLKLLVKELFSNKLILTLTLYLTKTNHYILFYQQVFFRPSDREKKVIYWMLENRFVSKLQANAGKH